MKNLIAFLLPILLLISCIENKSLQPNKESEPKIVSLNGSITETLFEFGWGSRIVGVDVTSTYPKETHTIPVLGHVKSIQTEAVMALKPTHIFVIADELNPTAIEQWKKSGIQVLEIQKEYSIEGCLDAIFQVGNILNEQEKARTIQQNISKEISSIKDTMATDKVLFIYARGGGNLMVSGANTPVAKMIALAGATNAITAFDDYKPLSTEYLVKANPDVILMFDMGYEAVGGVEGLSKIPGISETKAFQANRIITMDGQMLAGFGPRTAIGIKELQQKIFQNN